MYAGVACLPWDHEAGQMGVIRIHHCHSSLELTSRLVTRECKPEEPLQCLSSLGGGGACVIDKAPLGAGSLKKITKSLTHAAAACTLIPPEAPALSLT